MRTFGKWLGRVLLTLVIVTAGIWFLAPREPVDREISFDQSALTEDLDAYLAASESKYTDIIPGVEKRIIWAGEPGAQTDLAIVYIHGYSATSEEIRPVPDKVAKSLGANLFFTRLRGHGRGGDAMAEATAGDWLEDTVEAIAIGRRLGKEVILMSTSTGGTAVAILATEPGLMDGVKGTAFVSPNFKVAAPAATLLTWPFVRQWAPYVVGPERSFEPVNEGHGKYWMTRYPTVAAIPVGALVNHAYGLDYDTVNVPAMFVFSEKDKVVSPEAARNVAERWGWEVRIENPVMGPGDDPYHHVIAGDILSPGQTDKMVATMLDWIKGLD